MSDTIFLILCCSFQIILAISSVFTAPHKSVRNTNDLGGGGGNRAECYNKIVTWRLDMICPIGTGYRLFMPCCSVMCSRHSMAVMLVVYSMHISVKWINSYLIVFCENTISLKQLRQERSLSNKEQKRVRDFLYHGYLSCDFRECKRVGKSLGAITLWVHKKITKKNTGKP